MNYALKKIDKAAVLELKISEAKKMQADLTEDSVQVTNKLAQFDEMALQQELQQIYAKRKSTYSFMMLLRQRS